MTAIIFILIAFVLLLLFIFRKRLFSGLIEQTWATPETPAYPFNSFDFVSSRLPGPPAGYMFEHKVYTNKCGTVMQSLGLIRMADEQPVEKREIDLSNDTKVHITWEEHSRTYPMIHRSECRANSLALVDVANKWVLKYNIGEQPTRYEMKG